MTPIEPRAPLPSIAVGIELAPPGVMGRSERREDLAAGQTVDGGYFRLSLGRDTRSLYYDDGSNLLLLVTLHSLAETFLAATGRPSQGMTLQVFCDPE